MLLSQLTCGKCNVTYFSFLGLNRGSRILYLARLERALSCCLLLRHLLFHHLHHSLQSRFWLPVLLDSQESFARLWTLQSRVLSPSCIMHPFAPPPPLWKPRFCGQMERWAWKVGSPEDLDAHFGSHWAFLPLTSGYRGYLCFPGAFFFFFLSDDTCKCYWLNEAGLLMWFYKNK